MGFLRTFFIASGAWVPLLLAALAGVIDVPTGAFHPVFVDAFAPRLLHVQFVISRFERRPRPRAPTGEGDCSKARIAVKRLVLIAALLLGTGLSAHADTVTYHNVLKQPRNNDQLHEDRYDCDAQVGPTGRRADVGSL